MFAKTVSTLIALTLAFALVGCASSPGNEPVTGSTPPADGGAASGSRLAPGLYDLEDGTVQAVGTVEFRDLEGGFWAVIGGTEAEGDAGKTIAVIANGADYAQQLEDLKGLSVIVTGTRLEGASIRMAGPEIKATSVVAASEAGPAE